LEQPTWILPSDRLPVIENVALLLSARRGNRADMLKVVRALHGRAGLGAGRRRVAVLSVVDYDAANDRLFLRQRVSVLLRRRRAIEPPRAA
jgi:hypothetical protein